MFPEELATEIAWEVDVAGSKGVDHEERVEVDVEEVVKGMATVSELLYYRASHIKGLGGHCNTQKGNVSAIRLASHLIGETY